MAVRLVMLALALWTVTVGPAMAQPAAKTGEEAQADPCPGCPEQDTPCAPTCTDCACLPFARSVPAPSPSFSAPVLPMLPPAPVVVFNAEAPSEPQLEALFHPPRR